MPTHAQFKEGVLVDKHQLTIHSTHRNDDSGNHVCVTGADLVHMWDSFRNNRAAMQLESQHRCKAPAPSYPEREFAICFRCAISSHSQMQGDPAKSQDILLTETPLRYTGFIHI